MSTRLVRYVGRTSGNPTATLDDGRQVNQGDAVEVDPKEARLLLRAPGESGDDNAEWIPAKRDEEV